MTAVKRVTALRQLDSMFGNLDLGEHTHTFSVIEHDPQCDVHGRNSPNRHSQYFYSRENSPALRKGSVSPTNGFNIKYLRRRASLGIPASPPCDFEHPSAFPSTLRREPDHLRTSSTSLRRESPSPTPRLNSNRYSMGSIPNISRNNIFNYQRPSSAASNSSSRQTKRDYVGSTSSLSRKNLSENEKSSVDSLDSWLHSTGTERKTSITSNSDEQVPDERLYYKRKGQNMASGSRDSSQHSQSNARIGEVSGSSSVAANGNRPTFKPVTILEDAQAIRCAEFHPNGHIYAVGSNSKTLRICQYPQMNNKACESTAPSVLLKRTKHHRGSVYCLAWSPAGDLLATGSNDKTAKYMRFNNDACNLEREEMEVNVHHGTVRDICFIEDTMNKTSLLVSGGGDSKVYVTDCKTGEPFLSLCGHTGQVLSLYSWGGVTFVSGSQDKTIRVWDLRTGGCVNVVSPYARQPNNGTAVVSVAVEPSGRLMISGHEDGSAELYDIRGRRPLQRYTPHTSDARSVRFSPGAFYLLTAGYDGNIILSDLQGDLTRTLPCVTVANHLDKVISARWHPEDFSFISTSADKTAVLWSIPTAASNSSHFQS